MSAQLVGLAASDVTPEWLEELLGLFHSQAGSQADHYTDLAFRLGVERAELDTRVAGLFDPEARAFIQEFSFNAITKLSEDQKSAVRGLILESIADGQSAQETSRQLRVAFDRSEPAARLRTIARTELNRSANWGRLAGWRKSKVVEGKEFIASNDDRVRASHLAADGEVVPVDQPFKRGAAAGQMAPPLDPNCRCSFAPVVDATRTGRGSVASAPAESEEQERRRANAAAMFGLGAVDDEFQRLRSLERDFERDLFAPWNEVRDAVLGQVMRSG